MAVSFGCHCPERQKPVKDRLWRVCQRNCHHSAFSGYHLTSSVYSEVVCLNCNARGRTKAAYVDFLPTHDKDEYIRERTKRGDIFT